MYATAACNITPFNVHALQRKAACEQRARLIPVGAARQWPPRQIAAAAGPISAGRWPGRAPRANKLIIGHSADTVTDKSR